MTNEPRRWTDRSRILALAREMLSALDDHHLVEPPSERFADVGFDTAYDVAAESNRLRRARGERPVGRKIGYTNRVMWARFGVHQPMWDFVFAHTTQFARDNAATLSLATMVAPRIEPEIAFKLRAPLPLGCRDPALILQSVEWMARTFEVVDCHYADWKFKGPDSVIDFSHHAALIVGEPREIDPHDIPKLVDELRDCSVSLIRNGALAESGVGANALGHPALALAHLADTIAAQPESPPLEVGEIITTGTLTVALPAHPGETWLTATEGLTLPSLSVSLT